MAFDIEQLIIHFLPKNTGKTVNTGEEEWQTKKGMYLAIIKIRSMKNSKKDFQSSFWYNNLPKERLLS